MSELTQIRIEAQEAWEAHVADPKVREARLFLGLDSDAALTLISRQNFWRLWLEEQLAAARAKLKDLQQRNQDLEIVNTGFRMMETRLNETLRENNQLTALVREKEIALANALNDCRPFQGAQDMRQHLQDEVAAMLANFNAQAQSLAEVLAQRDALALALGTAQAALRQCAASVYIGQVTAIVKEALEQSTQEANPTAGTPAQPNKP